MVTMRAVEVKHTMTSYDCFRMKSLDLKLAQLPDPGLFTS
jgi:hypothetical protein